MTFVKVNVTNAQRSTCDICHEEPTLSTGEQGASLKSLFYSSLHLCCLIVFSECEIVRHMPKDQKYTWMVPP